MLSFTLTLMLVLLVAETQAASHRISWGPDVSQASITVARGDTVTWVLDQVPLAHTLSSATMSTALGFTFGGSFEAGESYTLVADMPAGTYAYLSRKQPSTMWATLTVEEEEAGLLSSMYDFFMTHISYRFW
jgi:plastocyanin